MGENRAYISDFRERTRESFHDIMGIRPDQIEEQIKAHLQELVEDYGLDVNIEDVIVSGSRCRGIEGKDSDLDVVLYYNGSEKEKNLFNLLADEGIFIGDVKVDINPISRDEHGYLADYLKEVDTYLADKAAGRLKPQKDEALVTYTVAASGELHNLYGFREDITTIEEAKQVYDAFYAEHSSDLPAIGIKVHAPGGRSEDDTQWDFYFGGKIDLQSLVFLPEIFGNADAMEKLKQLMEAFPEAEVIGHIPGEEPKKSEDKEAQKEESKDSYQPEYGDMDAVKPVFKAESIKLGEDIDAFMRTYDPVAYQEAMGDEDDNVQSIAGTIENGNAASIIQYLQSAVDWKEGGEDDLEKARKLLQRLEEYKPLVKVEEVEEQNYNMIDNTFNNGYGEKEKKEEEKKVRETVRHDGRVSMKKLLAEKLAEVAAREKASAPPPAREKPQGGPVRTV